MNCQEFQNILKAYRDGGAPKYDSRAVVGHIRNCSACRSGMTAEDLVEILPAVDSWIEPSGDFSSRFYAELQSRRNAAAADGIPAPRRKASWLTGSYLRLAAAGLLIVLVGAGFYWRNKPAGVPDTSAVRYDIEVTDDLTLFQDMALFEDLDLFQDFDTIENLPQLN
jgi:hypothetical protein